MEAIGICAAGPQPEVAPNHVRLRRARVALIAGWGYTGMANTGRVAPGRGTIRGSGRGGQRDHSDGPCRG